MKTSICLFKCPPDGYTPYILVFVITIDPVLPSSKQYEIAPCERRRAVRAIGKVRRKQNPLDEDSEGIGKEPL